MIAALADAVVVFLLLLALFACMALCVALIELRAMAPHWSVLNVNIDLRPMFDNPLRLVESWMRDIEDWIMWNLHEMWDAWLEVVKLVGYIAGFPPIHAVTSWIESA